MPVRFTVQPGAHQSLRQNQGVSVIKDVWILVALFVPLVYIAILSRRDEPTQRLVAVLHALAKLWRK